MIKHPAGPGGPPRPNRCIKLGAKNIVLFLGGYTSSKCMSVAGSMYCAILFTICMAGFAICFWSAASIMKNTINGQLRCKACFHHLTLVERNFFQFDPEFLHIASTAFSRPCQIMRIGRVGAERAIAKLPYIAYIALPFWSGVTVI